MCLGMVSSKKMMSSEEMTSWTVIAAPGRGRGPRRISSGQFETALRRGLACRPTLDSPKTSYSRAFVLNRPQVAGVLHSSKLTWKWRWALLRTTILYIGPFISFHINLGEGSTLFRSYFGRLALNALKGVRQGQERFGMGSHPQGSSFWWVAMRTSA